ncbi:hypothetical protein ECDEC7C_5342 [Escherichia coli DEC7C]|nr:hypothetical protein ECDEC7C_5342 [Escherichia coli DEC7C]
MGCSPRPVTGQADRGIPQPSLFDGKAMPRKRLEGRSSEKGDGLAYTVTDASRER